jgi:hypothetical protein
MSKERIKELIRNNPMTVFVVCGVLVVAILCAVLAFRPKVNQVEKWEEAVANYYAKEKFSFRESSVDMSFVDEYVEMYSVAELLSDIEKLRDIGHQYEMTDCYCGVSDTVIRYLQIGGYISEFKTLDEYREIGGYYSGTSDTHFGDFAIVGDQKEFFDEGQYEWVDGEFIDREGIGTYYKSYGALSYKGKRITDFEENGESIPAEPFTVYESDNGYYLIQFVDTPESGPAHSYNYGKHDSYEVTYTKK